MESLPAASFSSSSSSTLLDVFILFGLALTFVLLGVWMVRITAKKVFEKKQAQNIAIAAAQQHAPLKRLQITWPFAPKQTQISNDDMQVSFPIRFPAYAHIAVQSAVISLESSLDVILDTGSFNFVVSKNSAYTTPSSILSSSSSQCQTLTYASGSAYACLGAVQFTDKKTLAAEIFSSSKQNTGFAAQPNILGLMPGPETGATSIVRQLGLTSICLNFQRQLATFERTIHSSFVGRRSIVAVHPFMSTMFLTVVPWKVEWAWNDGTTTIWQQWLDCNTQRVMTCTGNTRDSTQNMSPFVFVLDTGTTLDITSVTNDANGHPQESPILYTGKITTTRTCKSVTLTMSAFEVGAYKRGLTSISALRDYLLPNPNTEKEKPSITCTFDLIEIFQAYNITRIPTLESNSNENMQRVLLGLNAFRGTNKMKVYFSPSNSTSSNHAPSLTSHSIPASMPLGVEFSN